MKLRKTPTEGNAWLLSICLVIFITLWKFIFFLNLFIADFSCRQRYPFWLAETDAAAPFNLSVFAFSLFGLWALIEIYLAHRTRSPVRWTSTTVGLLCLILSVEMLVGLRAQYESFEIEWGARARGDIIMTGQYISPSVPKSLDPLRPYSWGDLWQEVRCNPEYKDPQTEREYCELLQKFDREHNTMLGHANGCT